MLCQKSQPTNDKEVVLSLSNGTALNGFSEQGFECVWRWEVNESDLNESLNTAFTAGKILIIQSFYYPEKVDKNCVNQMLHNSSGEEKEQ